MAPASLRPSTPLAASSASPHDQVRLRCASLRFERRCLGDTLEAFMRQTTRNRSLAVRCSSSALIRARRADSRRRPPISRCSISPMSSWILERTSTRSNDVPSARACRNSGRRSVRRMVRTVFLAVSNPTSNFIEYHSARLRQPSAEAICRRSSSSRTSMSSLSSLDLSWQWARISCSRASVEYSE